MRTIDLTVETQDNGIKIKYTPVIEINTICDESSWLAATTGAARTRLYNTGILVGLQMDDSKKRQVEIEGIRQCINANLGRMQAGCFVAQIKTLKRPFNY